MYVYMHSAVDAIHLETVHCLCIVYLLKKIDFIT